MVGYRTLDVVFIRCADTPQSYPIFDEATYNSQDQLRWSSTMSTRIFSARWHSRQAYSSSSEEDNQEASLQRCGFVHLGVKKTESSSESSTKWSSDETSAVDHIAECQRLREQLERVLVDHQRQEEEIVALRALAKSLTEEVEAIHERQQLRSSTCRGVTIVIGKLNISDLTSFSSWMSRWKSSREKMLNCVANLNTPGGAQVGSCFYCRKATSLQARCNQGKCRTSLCEEPTAERASPLDLLQKQLVRCKARQDDVAVRVSLERGNNQEEHDGDPQESEVARREREVFLRQCKSPQNSRASLSPERK
ncbi:hypothetical protein GQ600_16395 [Phytophthora cactorum]|nr:hypothetical protein GQ600_16395 [Phytophthora cactorum]